MTSRKEVPETDISYGGVCPFSDAPAAVFLASVAEAVVPDAVVEPEPPPAVVATAAVVDCDPEAPTDAAPAALAEGVDC